MATTSGSAADFDFLMGTWNCHHRYLVQRLADCHDWIEFDGDFAARKILGGFGNIDEGAINLPFPASAEEAGATPQIFIGVVERTWRAAIDLRGREGPLDLHLNAGLHHVVNAGNQEGRTVNRFEGRLQATLGLSHRGILR